MAGTAPPPSSPPGSGASSTSSVDATGTVASVDASSGTITLSDGRVLRATDRTVVYQPTTVQALKSGDRVLVAAGWEYGTEPRDTGIWLPLAYMHCM